MKVVVLMLTMFILTSCASMNPQLTPEQSQRSYVVDTKGSQKDNHTKSNLFIAKIFNSANNVIQMNNPESGTLVVKGITHCPTIKASVLNDPADISFTLTVNSKQDKVRFLFENISVSYTTAEYGKANRNDLISSKEDQDALTACLKADFVDGFAEVKKDDNW